MKSGVSILLAVDSTRTRKLEAYATNIGNPNIYP